MVNIFVYRHLGPRCNRNDATFAFHFCDLKMTLQGHPRLNVFCEFWKSDFDFPIVLHSNNMYVSHCLAAIHECNRQTTAHRLNGIHAWHAWCCKLCLHGTWYVTAVTKACPVFPVFFWLSCIFLYFHENVLFFLYYLVLWCKRTS